MSTEPAAVVTLEEQRSCPVTALLQRLGDRWSAVVVRTLAERPHGFNELDRRIDGVSRRMLTRTLRALESDGFVSRTPRATAGGRVEYALTATGHALRDHLASLGRWAAEDRPGHPVSSLPAAPTSPPAQPIRD